jgi:hypothetical protein
VFPQVANLRLRRCGLPTCTGTTFGFDFPHVAKLRLRRGLLLAILCVP